MSRLANRAEIIKLGQSLGRTPQQLAFLQAVPAEDLQGLRMALDEVWVAQYQQPLRRAAAILRWLPRRLIAFLIPRLFGPRLGARLAAELPARLVARLTPHMSDDFVAESARYVDPRRLRDAIAMTPLPTSLQILRRLLQRGDYVTLGRVLEFLPDETVRAMAGLIEDEAALVEIAFYLESKSRLDHFLRLLPPERLRKAILLLQDPSRRELWPKLMILLMHGNPALQRELIALIAGQGEAVMNALVLALHEDGLFADVVQLTAAAAPEVQQQMANLAVLRTPGVMEHLVHAVDEDNAWGAHLAMLRWTSEDLRRREAELLDAMPEQTLERLVHAAMLGELWAPTLDLVARMSAPRQREFADILRRYGAVDSELLARVAREAAQLGLGHLFLEE